MPQHFLLSPVARRLSVAAVARLSEDDAVRTFRRLRWPATQGEPICPACGSMACYAYRSRPIFRCKACRRQFSVTSGTLFAAHKLSIRTYLLAIALFVNAAKGLSMLQLARDLAVSYKTAFVLAHKLREAMASELKGLSVGGDGAEVEVDGAWFGGHVRPRNRRGDRVDRRRAEHRSGKRRCVVVVRERGGRTLPAVFDREEDGEAFIRARVAVGTTVYADEAAGWNGLHARYPMRRINHAEAYSHDGACTNQAESYHARLRRAELGQHHHIAGPYLRRYAQEMAWREDTRRDGNADQYHRVGAAAAACRPSVDFCGYWQRHRQTA